MRFRFVLPDAGFEGVGDSNVEAAARGIGEDVDEVGAVLHRSTMRLFPLTCSDLAQGWL